MYKYPFVSIQMVIIVVFDQLSYFKRYYTFVLIILTICYIHPIEKTLSGEKHKSVMMQPNGPPRIMTGLRSHIKNSKECFIRYPNTSKSVKKTRLRLVFSTHFSGFGYPDETLFLVFDILLQNGTLLWVLVINSCTYCSNAELNPS